MRISRSEVLQSLLELKDGSRYLEIGVATGATFHSVNATAKVAVDPKFLFDVADARQRNPEATYHEVSSDEYFASIHSPGERFDTIFLDGLHTSQQTLRDLLNAVDCLAHDGVIVIDDAIPKNYAASLVDRRESRVCREALHIKGGSWMGDVYRLAFFIETFMQQFSYRTITDNHGQIVLWREKRRSLPERTIAQVGGLEYKVLFTERDAFSFTSFDELLSLLAARRT